MELEFITAAMGVMLSILTAIGRKLGVSPRYLILIFCVVTGASYTYAQKQMSPEIIKIIAESLGFASVFYMTFIKNLQSKKNEYN